MKTKNCWLLIIGAILFVSLIWLFIFYTNNHFKKQTFESIDKELQKPEWNNLTKEEHLHKCYDLIVNRFDDTIACWRKHPLRNFYSTNMWELEGKCLSCRIHSQLFQKCLLKRFDKNTVHIKITSCIKKWALIHYHTQVYLNGEVINVDTYFAKRGIKFGEHLCG